MRDRQLKRELGDSVWHVDLHEDLAVCVGLGRAGHNGRACRGEKLDVRLREQLKSVRTSGHSACSTCSTCSTCSACSACSQPAFDLGGARFWCGAAEPEPDVDD